MEDNANAAAATTKLKSAKEQIYNAFLIGEGVDPLVDLMPRVSLLLIRDGQIVKLSTLS